MCADAVCSFIHDLTIVIPAFFLPAAEVTVIIFILAVCCAELLPNRHATKIFYVTKPY